MKVLVTGGACFIGSHVVDVLLKNNHHVQCIAGIDIPFGKTQTPGLMDYADGVDTVEFLLTL